MTRKNQTRAERIAWDRALGRPVSAKDQAFLRQADTAPQAAHRSARQADRIIGAVRRITHGDPDAATGAERRALFEALMSRRGDPPTNRSLWFLGWAGAAVAAAVAVFLLIPWGAPRPTVDGAAEHVAVRGDSDVLPVAGLGISGVDGTGAEYEVVHGAGLCAEDALRFYLTVRDARTPHFVLFGVQDPDDPTWYLPAPRDAQAPAIPEVPALAWMVPFEIVVDGTHSPGPVSVVCILSEEPIRFTALEAAWRDAVGDEVSSRAADAAASLTAGAARILVDEIEILEDCGRRP